MNSLTGQEIAECLDVAKDIAVKAGRVAMEMSANVHVDRYKAEHEIVTQADLDVDDLVRAAIQTCFPEHGFISEEGGEKNQYREPG